MLNRLHPARDIDRLLDDVDQIVTSGIGRARAFTRRHSAHPAVDLYDTGTDLVVKALIPGARPEDITVSIDKGAVSLQGDIGYALGDEEEQNVTWHRREIPAGHFADTITLPVEVDVERARATFVDGILTLILPKVTQARGTRIAVRGEDRPGDVTISR
jgi:HSP20 family protein